MLLRLNIFLTAILSVILFNLITHSLADEDDDANSDMFAFNSDPQNMENMFMTHSENDAITTPITRTTALEALIESTTDSLQPSESTKIPPVIDECEASGLTTTFIRQSNLISRRKAIYTARIDFSSCILHCKKNLEPYSQKTFNCMGINFSHENANGECQFFDTLQTGDLELTAFDDFKHHWIQKVCLTINKKCNKRNISFDAIFNHKMKDVKTIKLINTNRNECLNSCLEHLSCNGVNFNKRSNACQLLQFSHYGLKNQIIKDAQVDFYKSECAKLNCDDQDYGLIMLRDSEFGSTVFNTGQKTFNACVNECRVSDKINCHAIQFNSDDKFCYIADLINFNTNPISGRHLYEPFCLPETTNRNCTEPFNFEKIPKSTLKIIEDSIILERDGFLDECLKECYLNDLCHTVIHDNKLNKCKFATMNYNQNKEKFAFSIVHDVYRVACSPIKTSSKPTFDNTQTTPSLKVLQKFEDTRQSHSSASIEVMNKGNKLLVDPFNFSQNDKKCEEELAYKLISHNKTLRQEFRSLHHINIKSQDRCQVLCTVSKFSCKAFAYNKRDSICFLSTKNIDSLNMITMTQNNFNFELFGTFMNTTCHTSENNTIASVIEIKKNKLRDPKKDDFDPDYQHILNETSIVDDVTSKPKEIHETESSLTTAISSTENNIQKTTEAHQTESSLSGMTDIPTTESSLSGMTDIPTTDSSLSGVTDISTDSSITTNAPTTEIYLTETTDPHQTESSLGGKTLLSENLTTAQTQQSVILTEKVITMLTTKTTPQITTPTLIPKRDLITEQQQTNSDKITSTKIEKLTSTKMKKLTSTEVDIKTTPSPSISKSVIVETHHQLDKNETKLEDPIGTNAIQMPHILEESDDITKLTPSDLHVRVICFSAGANVTFKVNNMTKYSGAVYAAERFSQCRLFVQDSNFFTLFIPRPSPNSNMCNALEIKRQMTAILVVSNDLVQPYDVTTKDDFFYEIKCDYSGDNKQEVIRSGLVVGGPEPRIIADGSHNNANKLASVKLKIMRDEKTVEHVFIGEQLKAVLKTDINHKKIKVLDCNVTRVGGHDPTVKTVQLISEGCSTMPQIISDISLGQFGLEANFTAFRIDGSDQIDILCNVMLCTVDCAPAIPCKPKGRRLRHATKDMNYTEHFSHLDKGSLVQVDQRLRVFVGEEVSDMISKGYQSSLIPIASTQSLDFMTRPPCLNLFIFIFFIIIFLIIIIVLIIIILCKWRLSRKRRDISMLST